MTARVKTRDNAGQHLTYHSVREASIVNNKVGSRAKFGPAGKTVGAGVGRAAGLRYVVIGVLAHVPGCGRSGCCGTIGCCGVGRASGGRDDGARRGIGR